MAWGGKLFPDGRRAQRLRTDISVVAQAAHSASFGANVDDLSTRGFRMAVDLDLRIPSSLTIAIPGLGLRSAVIVRRAGERRYGCEFMIPLSPDEMQRTLHMPDGEQGGEMPRVIIEAPGPSRWHRLLAGQVFVTCWLTVVASALVGIGVLLA